MSATGRPMRLNFPAWYLARIHTCLAFAAFLSALALGCLLHYKKIVKNGVAGYPQEWFPSVSATIGDWYPERNVFQILIAINSGPRFSLALLQYYLHRSSSSRLPVIVLWSGILRTLSCGGWVYITSTDDHDAHDVLMISYIVLNVPWMFGSIACTPAICTEALKRRRLTSTVFFVSLVPLIYYFIQHKVYRIPGAYTKYSFFEWGLIFFDVMYDSASELELRASDLRFALGVSLSSGAGVNDIVQATNAHLSTADIASEESSPAKTIKLLKAPQNDSISSSFNETLRLVLDFSSDLYLSYVYWSIYTSLTPTLFYFSVWELGIAGQELALLSTLSPILLAIPSFSRFCRSRAGRTTLHALSFAGLGAYALESPLYRLFVVAFATAIATIGATVDWTGGDVGYNGILTGLGFLLSSIAKHANHSNNPVWPNVDERSGGYNKAGLTLALIALVNFYLRAERSPAALQSAPASSGNWLASALSMGSLIFALHRHLVDPSTLIAWSWTGYPIKGPVPHLHGSLTHIAQAIGLSLPLLLTSFSLDTVQLLLHPAWLAYGATSAYVLYCYRDWLGYAGGLGYALFLMSVLPVIMQRVARTGAVAKTYFVAWLTVCVFVVADVFTVAYAFVPGGQYFRERTNFVLAAEVCGIVLALHRPSATSLPAFNIPQHTRSLLRFAIALLTILSLLVTVYRWPTKPITPHRPGAHIVRGGIWTVHFGIDNEGRDSQRRMRDLIRDMELDIVGLLETDLHRTVYGGRDLSRVMVEELGYYVDIGPGPNSHTWGAVLLSKFPIINSTHHLLPSPDGELAPAIEAVLDMYGTEVTVIVAHNGQEETPLDRELQAMELARIMSRTYPNPVIFLGYVVTSPKASRPAPYEIMVTDGRVHDVDDEDWDRWCEYIFYRGLYRTSYARVSRSTITDTEMQIGQFIVPKKGSGVVNDGRDARYLRAWKEDLPQDHWFPMEYYPDVGGKRGHFYHVFDSPLYYKLPEGAVV